MEKLQCKYCNTLNNPKRDYCWLCGKQLKEHISEKQDSQKEVIKKIKCANCNTLNNPKRDYCWMCSKELKGEEINYEKNSRKKFILIVLILFIIVVSYITLAICAISSDNEMLQKIFLFSVLGLILLIPIIIIYFGISNLSNTQKPKEIQTLFQCKYIDGTLDFLPNTLCRIDLSNDKITIRDNGSICNLQYQQIISITFTTRENLERIYESKESPYKKVITNSLLFGNVGAIAGATSANQITSHIEKNYEDFIVIRYISKNNKKSVIYLHLEDNKRKFKKRLNYINVNFITNNNQTIVENL